MIVGARNFVTVPAPDLMPGGVLAVARVIDSDDPHDLLGAEYETNACADGDEWLEFCTRSGFCTTDPTTGQVTWTPSPTGTKLFDDAGDIVVGDPFAVYAGVECSFIQLDTIEEQARERLRYVERRIVDRHIAEWMATHAVEVAAGPLSITQAIGALEDYAGAVYGGVPTMLMSRSMTTCACHAQIIGSNLDSSLQTCQGTKVANLSGVGAGNLETVYVSGQITLIRGPVKVVSAPNMPRCDGETQPFRALAERIYVPLVECLVGKTTAACECGCCSDVTATQGTA